MKPSPAQARLLRSLSSKDVFVYANRDSGGHFTSVNSERGSRMFIPTFESSFKAGWIEAIEFSYKDFRDRDRIETRYFLSQSGRATLQQLNPEDFLTKSSTMSSGDVIAILHKKYSQPEWLFIPELRLGSGYGNFREKRIDAWTLNCFPSKNFIKLAFEIKVSRQDFLREIANPDKSKAYMRVCNEFYFATIEGVAKEEEIPDRCGWFLISETGASLKKKAEWHECPPIDWAFVASVFRRIPLESSVSVETVE